MNSFEKIEEIKTLVGKLYGDIKDLEFETNNNQESLEEQTEANFSRFFFETIDDLNGQLERIKREAQEFNNKVH